MGINKQKLSMSKRGRGGRNGVKVKISNCLPVAAVMNCADNTGAKNLYMIACGGTGARLNRMPADQSEIFSSHLSRRVSPSSERKYCKLSSSVRERHTAGEKVTSSTSKTTPLSLSITRAK